MQRLDIEFEKAVRLLAEHFPVSEADSRKSALAHDIRVGAYLYEKNYARDMVLAGVLHDALEFSGINEQDIRDEFGEDVLKLVKANTKNREIENSDERIQELAARAAVAGQAALIIRAADTLDSFKHYTQTKNISELEYCRQNAKAIFENLKPDQSDPVFDELRQLFETA